MKKLSVKNWADFQHYKDRSPPWIKLHKTLLDNYEYQCLPIASRALAPMIWLLASESNDGLIDADTKKLAFRLRVSEQEIIDGIKPLIENNFLVDASEVLADCKQIASTETEGETEGEGDKRKSKKTSISENFSISSRVQKWADSNGHLNLDAHLANFVLVCKAKNYQYVDWDSAFMNAISKNWADVKKTVNDKPAYQRNIT